MLRATSVPVTPSSHGHEWPWHLERSGGQSIDAGLSKQTPHQENCWDGGPVSSPRLSPQTPRADLGGHQLSFFL